MALDIPTLEVALLTIAWKKDITPGATADLAKVVVNGAFRDVLTSPQAKEIFTVTASDPEANLQSWIDAPKHNDAETELSRLAIAVACLCAFLQANWTGPHLDVTPLDVLSLSQELASRITADSLDAKSVAELAFGGEPAYHLAHSPTFLRLAQILLAPPFTHCISAGWWRLRVAAVHAQVLDEPVPLPSTLFDAAVPIGDDPDVAGRLLLEKGLLYHHTGDERAAGALFVQATRILQLEYELTGALGKKTKFQQFDTSQLVLLAESRKRADDPQDATPTNTPAPAPETLALNDDTLLEQTAFTVSSSGTGKLAHLNPAAQPPLHPLDQSVLLALCVNVRNTSPAHGLTHEQMAPYAARVLAHARNWSVHTTALLLRARVEATRTRTAERAVLQLQALVDQMPSADAAVPDRLRYVQVLALPSKWALERELAGRMLTLGAVRSALEIYERLELWEDVVRCHQVLERRDLALRVVRDLLGGARADADAVLERGKAGAAPGSARRISLDSAREAKLWCVLGDIEPERAQEHYEKAWAVSNGTSGRAMRSLGGLRFARAEYSGAIECLKKAVAINPLVARSWFVLGCACTRMEDWKGARDAFARCVSIDDTDAESWSNLASTYLRMGDEPVIEGGDDAETAPDASFPSIPFSHKTLAFRALQHGLKHAYENWRMWSNFSIVALDVGELAEAARAVGRVAECRAAKDGAACLDMDIIARLVAAASRSAADGEAGGAMLNPNEGKGLMPRVRDLFERVLLPRFGDPRIFRAYARLLTAEGQYDAALAAHLDAYRAGSAGTMEKGETDVERWREAVAEVVDVIDVLRNFGPRVEGSRWLAQARSIVRTFMGRTRDFEDEPEWVRLEELAEELKHE